jgi:hypothetical protein
MVRPFLFALTAVIGLSATGCAVGADPDGALGTAESAILTPSTTSIDFGRVIARGSAKQTITLYNRGTVDTEIVSALTVPPDPYIPPDPYQPGALAPCVRPGDSTSLTITFTPPSVGTFSEPLVIKTTTGGVDDRPISISLTGSGS